MKETPAAGMNLRPALMETTMTSFQPDQKSKAVTIHPSKVQGHDSR